MLSFLIFSLSLGISWVDIRAHRIPNKLSLLFLLANLLDSHCKSLGVTVVSVALMGTLFMALRIGMGDIKLAVVLITTQGGEVLTLDYLNRLALALFLAMVLHLCSKRTIKGSIAFAPVLLMPYLMLYLDI